MAKEPGDAIGIPDERDHLGAPTAVLAGLEVDGERAPEQLDEGTVLRTMRRRRQRRLLADLARFKKEALPKTPSFASSDSSRGLANWRSAER